MKLRTFIVIALALLCGVSAAVGTSSLRFRGGAASGAEMVSTVVTTMPIQRGVLVSSDMVTTRQCTKDELPEGTLTQLDDVLGRVVFIPLLKGEYVLAGKLAPKNGGRGLAALIPPGMQAISIQTPNVSTGVAGFILPGNWVDVLLTFNNQTTSVASGNTIRLLQHVEILAVDQRVDAPVDNKVDVKELRSVTLLVTPRQAALVALGQNKGTLQLSLRNPRDDMDAKLVPVSDEDLGIKSAVPPPEPKAIPSVPVVAKPAPPPEPLQPIQFRTARGGSEGLILLPPPPQD